MLDEDAARVPPWGRGDWGWMLGLMALGLGLRLLYASGIGLGDDFILRGEVANILISKKVLPDNQAYRFPWWLPTAFSCRIFGLTELGLVFPFTTASTLGIGLVYAIGRRLWGRPGGVIAALLLVVAPLDFAWSTMFTTDLILSVLSAVTIVLVLRAIDVDDPDRRRRAWTAAGVTFWLACHAKLSGFALAPVVAATCWTRRDRIDRSVLRFVVTAAALLGASALVSYVFAGDPLAAYHAELSFQGLDTPEAAVQHRFTSNTFWYYPRLLVLPDQLGDLLFSVYPHLLIALAVVAPFLGLRSSLVVFWWLLFTFLLMQFNTQRIGGAWVAGFRNIRHLHVLVYPIVLLLAGYLATLRSRHRRWHDVGLAIVLVVSAWQSVSAASKTKIAFADRRQACRFLATLPPKPTYADEGLGVWCTILDPKAGPASLKTLPHNPPERKAAIPGITSGYLVTGGAREPLYGCPHCIPRAEELPPGRWRLVKELPGPTKPTAWRTEPLRVWEAIEGG